MALTDDEKTWNSRTGYRADALKQTTDAVLHGGTETVIRDTSKGLSDYVV